MRVVIQRAAQAAVIVNNKQASSIGKGLVILLGIEHDDSTEDIDWLVGKISKLRVFDDDEGVMNRSVQDVKGELMVVSQFTLHASTKKGNRPSYIRAARPDHAIPLYNTFIDKMGSVSGCDVYTGEFGALMQVSLINDGPVTIIIDSKNKE
ncbi:MAG: D-aminoacyl-tRNA deacylase [Bacteroidales bacterium]